jgi:hypothetical protein
LLPEGGSREDIDRIWFKLATEGGRNGCPLWIVARRLALVNKTITIEAQQNMISFNTEDIDRHRIESDLGADFAGMLGALSPGEAMVIIDSPSKVYGMHFHRLASGLATWQVNRLTSMMSYLERELPEDVFVNGMRSALLFSGLVELNFSKVVDNPLYNTIPAALRDVVAPIFRDRRYIPF